MYEAYELKYTKAVSCSVGEIRLDMSSVGVGPILPKGSPYKRTINYGWVNELKGNYILFKTKR